MDLRADLPGVGLGLEPEAPLDHFPEALQADLRPLLDLADQLASLRGRHEDD